MLAPWHSHAAARITLAQQPALWTHNDWHVSNLLLERCWRRCLGERCTGFRSRLTHVRAVRSGYRDRTQCDRVASAGARRWRRAHADIALALIDGYREIRPLGADDVHLLADLLPLVHVDFALSEVEYFHAVIGLARQCRYRLRDVSARAMPRGLAARPGQSLLQAIRDAA